MSGTQDPKSPRAPAPGASPGEMIAAARKRRGLTLEDLAERTKIPTAMLQALEADEYHRLSGPLYARSFLRTCAKELELPLDDILDSFASHNGEVTRPAGGPPRVEEAVRIRRVGLPWGRLAAGAVAVVAIATLAVVLTRPGGDVTDRTAADSSPQQAAATPAPAWTAADSGAPASETAVPAGVDPPAGVPGLDFSDGLTWPLVVRLRVSGPIAARAQRDDQDGFAEVVWPDAAPALPAAGVGLDAGRVYATGGGLVVYWGAVKRLGLVLGSAGGVELTVNGQSRALPAPDVNGDIVLDLQAAPPAPQR